MSKLLIASNNPGKVQEYQSLFQNYSFELITPAQLNISLKVDEIGKSYTENAIIKANTLAQASGYLTLADDSGLEVDSLDGLPGIYSARFSPIKNADDADRRRYLLDKLKDKPHPWLAHFHCSIAIVRPGEEAQFTQGVCYGEIIPEERGLLGFGYDPIFYLPQRECTMAELTLHEKNQLSHRGLAFQAAIPILDNLSNKQEY